MSALGRWRAARRSVARTSKRDAAGLEARETAQRRRELDRRGLLPPASASELAGREFAAGNWRPPIG